MKLTIPPDSWPSIAPDRIKPHHKDWKDIQAYNLQLLCRALASQTTIVFTGAGVSLDHKLPLWGELYQRLFDSLKNETAPQLGNLAIPLGRLADQHSDDEQRRSRSEGFQSTLANDLPSAFQLLQEAIPCPPEAPARERRRRFTNALEMAIGDPQPPADEQDPYRALLQLPVRRFVTTNYDNILEKTIKDVLAVPLRRMDPDSRSFTQRNKAQMPRFSIALAPDNHYMVFHCHGSLDSLRTQDASSKVEPPDDIIITESDYKYWYLAESPHASGFRLLLDVILLSSPILFIGYSLGDDDLLRALRLLSLNRESSSTNSKVFALMRGGRDANTELQFRALQNRYGINVIGIDVKKNGDLCNRLTDLKTTYHSERKLWRLQPMGRKLKPDAVRYRLQPQSPTDPLFHEATVSADRGFTKMVGFLNSDKFSVLVVHGEAGAGKYERASQLLHGNEQKWALLEGTSYEYVFFSSHDTDDLYLHLKKVVLATEHLAFGNKGNPNRPKDLVKRLEVALSTADKPICVVLSGLDRFLYARRDSTMPRRPNKLTHDLLEFLSSAAPKTVGKGKLILTSRYNLTSGSGTSLTMEPDLTELTGSYATALAKQFGISRDISRLLRMVNGHYSSFVIAVAWLASLEKHKVERELDEMVDRLVGAVSERSSRLVRYVLRQIAPTFRDRVDGDIELLDSVLTHLSCFTRPFNAISIGELCRFSTTGRQQGIDPSKVISELLRFRLIEIVNPPETLYVVSPIVRQYCRARGLGCTMAEVRAFGLHGYTSRGNFVDAGSSSIPEEFFKALSARAREVVKAISASESQLNEKDLENRAHEARTLVRASYDVLRTNYACNSVPRWGTFGQYVRMCAECFDLVKNYCIAVGEKWQPDLGNANCVGDKGPLTPEEIVWLLNEMGLAYYGEGSVQEAIGVWGLAFEWQKSLRRDDPEQSDMYMASLLCHLGAANLQIGRLAMAGENFERALKHARDSSNLDLGTRIKGFLARLEHFRGSVRSAETGYEKVLSSLEKTGNKRAQSYFMRHRAALHVRQGNFTLAERLISDSMVLAAAENYPDFVAYSRELLARLMVRNGRLEDAAREYSEALREAKRMGMYRLEADVLLGLARVQLQLGDATVARRQALESLRIANQYVLALRQDRALVVLGKANVKLGERESGREFLKLARDLAGSHEFRLIQREAEEELSRLDAEGGMST